MGAGAGSGWTSVRWIEGVTTEGRIKSRGGPGPHGTQRPARQRSGWYGASPAACRVAPRSLQPALASAAPAHSSPHSAHLDVWVGVGPRAVADEHGVTLREVAGALGAGLHLRGGGREGGQEGRRDTVTGSQVRTWLYCYQPFRRASGPAPWPSVPLPAGGPWSRHQHRLRHPHCPRTALSPRNPPSCGSAAIPPFPTCTSPR